MLEQIFSKILDMSTTASIVFVIVFLSRFFLRKYPKIISYALWSAVFLSLILPFSIPLPEGILPKWVAEPVVPVMGEDGSLPKNGDTVNADGFFLDGHQAGDEAKRNSDADTDKIDTDRRNNGMTSNNLNSANTDDNNSQRNHNMFSSVSDNTKLKEGNESGIVKFFLLWNKRIKSNSVWRMNFLLYGKYVWLSGTLLILSYMLISFIKLKRKIRFAVPHRDNILIMDQNISPFVIGIVKPKIYLPQGLSESEQDYTILHEQVHIRRLDYLIKVIAFLALALHWFNPLAWIAFSLLSKDMEMSCDEAVIRMLGENARADYAQCLLILSGGRSVMNRVPLAFGKEDIVGRIKNLKDKKTKKGILLAVTITIPLILTCFLFSHMRIRAREEKAEAGGITAEEVSKTAETGAGNSANEEIRNGNPEIKEAEDGNSDAQQENEVNMKDPDSIYQSVIASAGNCLADMEKGDMDAFYEDNIYDISHDCFSGAREEIPWQITGYRIMDINGDSIEELLLGANPSREGDNWRTIYDIYTLKKNGDNYELVHVLSGWTRNRYYLCENGMIMNEGSSSASEGTYSYYSFDGEGLELVERIIQTEQAGNGEHDGYFYTTVDNPDDAMDITQAVPVEEERRREIMGQYQKVLIDFIPFESSGNYDMKENQASFVNIQEEEFTNIMGFDHYEVTPAKELTPYFYRWRIYTESEGKEINLGEAFGYSDYSDSHPVNLVDIDQDGLTELICNCVYGDGAQRVIVFRNNNGVIEEGYVDEEKLIRDYGIDIWGVFSLEEQYIPDKREFAIVNHTGEGKDITLTFTNLDCFYFEPYQYLE